jgi:hypothetical protein
MKLSMHNLHVVTTILLPYSADKVQHDEMMLKIHNYYVLYGSPYPPTLTAAYDKLVNYKPSRPNFPRQNAQPMFLQEGSSNDSNVRDNNGNGSLHSGNNGHGAGGQGHSGSG